MELEKLVEFLLNKDMVTKAQLVEFGKICQYHVLNQIYDKKSNKETIRLIKNELITLKNDIEFNDNKYYIMTKNYSLN